MSILVKQQDTDMYVLVQYYALAFPPHSPVTSDQRAAAAHHTYASHKENQNCHDYLSSCKADATVTANFQSDTKRHLPSNFPHDLMSDVFSTWFSCHH